MPNKERVWEPLTTLPTAEYLARRIELGWRPAAIEWERDIVPEGERPRTERVPYGLQVAPDSAALVENSYEHEVLMLAMSLIVEDAPLSRVAAELNQHGYMTRDGHAWTPSDLFSLLPRMIQIGPRVFSSGEWMVRRQNAHGA